MPIVAASATPVTTITALAGLWEVWEWVVTVSAHRDQGTAYLGMQGDVWDAQKDILLAPLGAAVALLLFTRWHNALLDQAAARPRPA